MKVFMITAILTVATVSFARPQSLWYRPGYQTIPTTYYPGVRSVHSVIPYQYHPYSYYNAYPSPYAAIIPYQMPNAHSAAVKKVHQLVAKPYVFLSHCPQLKTVIPSLFRLQDKNSDGKVTWPEWSSITSLSETPNTPDDTKLPDIPVYNKHAFDIADDNKDKSLSYGEYYNAIDAFFDLQAFGQWDKNRDLLIDQAEWDELDESGTKIELYPGNDDEFFSFAEMRQIFEFSWNGDLCDDL